MQYVEKFQEDRYQQVSLPVSNKALRGVAIYEDKLYAGGVDKTLYEIDYSDLNQTTTTEHSTGHTGTISCLHVSEQFLVTGSWDKTVEVRSRADMQVLHTIRDHTDWVNDCRLHG